MAITAPQQVEVRGLLLGAGTSYIVEDFTGLTSRAVRSSDRPLIGATGSAAGRRNAAAVTRPLRVSVVADEFSTWDEFDDACTDLFTAWQLDDTETPVSYRESGSRVMRVYGFTDEIREVERTTNFATYLLELVCLDPYRYSDTADIVALDPGDTETVDNEGNVGTARWSAAFAAGPVGAKLLHEDGDFIDFDGYTLAATLTAHALDWTVRDASGDRVVPFPILETSEFFLLPPGESDITFTKDSGSDGTCTFEHRSAWS